MNQIINKYKPYIVAWFKTKPREDIRFEMHVLCDKTNGGGNVNRKVYNSVLDFVTRHKTKQPRVQAVYSKDSGIIFGFVDNITICYNNVNIDVILSEADKTNKIVLTASNMKILEDFVYEAESTYSDGQYVDRSGNSIYVWSNQWRPETLNVNKIRSNIYLHPDIEQKIFGGIEQFLNSEAYYTNHGIPYKKSFLFHGPGTGKSATVYALSKHFDIPLHIVRETFPLSNRITSSKLIILPNKNNPEQIKKLMSM